jgi:hypothetical protein
MKGKPEAIPIELESLLVAQLFFPACALSGHPAPGTPISRSAIIQHRRDAFGSTVILGCAFERLALEQLVILRKGRERDRD